ncbi:putative PAS/PAC sensor protein [Gammaproteobacteria bacterium]
MSINKRVLVIDDDQELLKTYKMIFSSSGSNEKKKTGLMAFADVDKKYLTDMDISTGDRFEVHIASQGEAGVQLARQFFDNDTPFAVAFIDIRMPPGIDGLETSQLIREIDDRIYIIIVTAYSDHSIDEIQMALQHDVVLANKPLSGDEIIQLARNACNSWERDQNIQHRQVTLQHTVRDEQWFLMDLLNMMPLAIFICNFHGTIISCNQAAYQLIQYPKKLVTLNKITDFFTDDGKSKDEGIGKVMESLAKQEEIRNVPSTILTYDGNKVPVQVMAGMLRRCYECADIMVFIINQATS